MEPLLIGVVGPCAAGKTTLVAGLNSLGYESRHIAQEHSYVPDMWLRITHPTLLIYLHVSYEFTLLRRKMNWTKREYEIQLERLRHARLSADLVIDTDGFAPAEVLRMARQFIEKYSNSSLE